MYADKGAPADEGAPRQESGGSGQSGHGDDAAVDAEFEEVKDDKRK
jgi:hypothetical protein